MCYSAVACFIPLSSFLSSRVCYFSNWMVSASDHKLLNFISGIVAPHAHFATILRRHLYFPAQQTRFWRPVSSHEPKLALGTRIYENTSGLTLWLHTNPCNFVNFCRLEPRKNYKDLYGVIEAWKDHDLIPKLQLRYWFFNKCAFFIMYFQNKGTGTRGHIVADTLLPTQMFSRLPARATFVSDTNFVSGTQNVFLILSRNILCPQQMFPSLRATMFPLLPGPYLNKSHDINNSVFALVSFSPAREWCHKPDKQNVIVEDLTPFQARK